MDALEEQSVFLTAEHLSSTLFFFFFKQTNVNSHLTSLSLGPSPRRNENYQAPPSPLVWYSFELAVSVKV